MGMGRESSMVRGVCEVCVAAGLVPRSSWGGWLAWVGWKDARLGEEGGPLRGLIEMSCRNRGDR